MKNIDTLVFDLDDTLYSASLGYRDQSSQRVADYISKKLQMSFEEFKTEMQHYLREFKTCILLFEKRNTSLEEFVTQICDLDMSSIEFNPELRKQLLSLPHRLIIYTDSEKIHVAETLKRLGLEDVLKEIFTIIETKGLWKDYDGSFERFAKLGNVNPKTTAVFEDNINNLKEAKKQGFTTILISEKEIEKPDHCDFMFKDINSALKLFTKDK